MEIVLNDLVFNYKMQNKYEIYNAIDKFIDMIIKLQKYRIEVKLLFNQDVRYIKLMDDYNMQKVYNDQNITRDKKSLLIRLLTRVKILDIGNSDVFVLDNNESKLCGWAHEYNNLVVSVITDDQFEISKLKGILKNSNEEVEISNIGNETHINEHMNILGIRIYEANPKHKIGSNWGSPMDLDDSIAQVVLDKAIVYENDDKCLVNYYNGKYYTFRRHINRCYHGYIDEYVPQNIKMKLQGKT